MRSCILAGLVAIGFAMSGASSSLAAPAAGIPGIDGHTPQFHDNTTRPVPATDRIRLSPATVPLPKGLSVSLQSQ